MAYTAYPWCGDNNVFFWNSSSDVADYRILDHVPELLNQRTITTTSFTSASGQVNISTWITPAGSPGTMTLAPGQFRFRTYAYASSDSGITRIHFYVINRSATGVETNLFYGNAISEDISGGTVPKEYLMSYARRNYTTFFAGDRLVIRAKASTDSAAARTLTLDVAGNTNASMVTMGYFVCNENNANPGARSVPISLFIPALAIIGAVLFLRRQQ
jgi:hypothetical protein